MAMRQPSSTANLLPWTKAGNALSLLKFVWLSSLFLQIRRSRVFACDCDILLISLIDCLAVTLAVWLARYLLLLCGCFHTCVAGCLPLGAPNSFKVELRKVAMAERGAHYGGTGGTLWGFYISNDCRGLLTLWSLEQIWTLFKHLVCTTKRKQRGSVINIRRLILFRELIAVYYENHTTTIDQSGQNTELVDMRWYIYLPQFFKQLKISIKFSLLHLIQTSRLQTLC